MSNFDWMSYSSDPITRATGQAAKSAEGSSGNSYSNHYESDDTSSRESYRLSRDLRKMDKEERRLQKPWRKGQRLDSDMRRRLRKELKQTKEEMEFLLGEAEKSVAENGDFSDELFRKIKKNIISFDCVTPVFILLDKIKGADNNLKIDEFAALCLSEDFLKKELLNSSRVISNMSWGRLFASAKKKKMDISQFLEFLRLKERKEVQSHNDSVYKSSPTSRYYWPKYGNAINSVIDEVDHKKEEMNIYVSNWTRKAYARQKEKEKTIEAKKTTSVLGQNAVRSDKSTLNAESIKNGHTKSVDEHTK